ncbi:response regulator transcription factor [Bacillus pseudomycoides]|uniref:response regulator n=1 Tax=Bacillus pseudomycoides TaxID=64104 RepID=UPI003D226681
MLVDDQPIIRQGLTYIFNSQSDMEVVGEADNGKDAVKIALRCIPDIVLMDVQMPQATGIDTTRNIVHSLPDTKIILLTTFDVQDYVFDGIRAGAAGYLLKDTQTKELLDGVRSIQRSATLYNSMTAKQALAKIINSRDNISTNQPKASPSIEPLTDREIEILQLIAYGKKNKEIANILYISEGIVKIHVHNIIQKLEVADHTQAVVLGIRMQLVG